MISSRRLQGTYEWSSEPPAAPGQNGSDPTRRFHTASVCVRLTFQSVNIRGWQTQTCGYCNNPRQGREGRWSACEFSSSWKGSLNGRRNHRTEVQFSFLTLWGGRPVLDPHKPPLLCFLSDLVNLWRSSKIRFFIWRSSWSWRSFVDPPPHILLSLSLMSTFDPWPLAVRLVWMMKETSVNLLLFSIWILKIWPFAQCQTNAPDISRCPFFFLEPKPFRDETVVVI